ncbi:MAG: PQQ-binding-like beta-propeller repeat protein [Bifidobacteriaceae bacterium]|jgi:hypothetical protein|nr:PQQ-binding-like beta-propeller repeat protein [Bifidobacteriaceae bacterium]
MFDPTQGPDAAARALADPSLDPVALQQIAAAFPQLAPQVAAHPRLYPDLEQWLRSLGRPDVDQALAGRAYGQAPPPAAYQTGPNPAYQTGPTPAYQTGPTPAYQTGPNPAYQTGPNPAYQTGPNPIYPPQGGPEAPAGGRKKSKMIPVIAGVAAVAVVGAGVFWFVGSRGGGNGGAAGQSLAPDITAEPTFGDQISTLDILDGDFADSSFGGFLSESTGLVIGTNEPPGYSSWYEGYDEDYEQGAQDSLSYEEAYEEWRACVTACPDYPYEDLYWKGDTDGYSDGWYGYEREIKPEMDGPLVVVAAFDLTSGERKWQTDIGAAFELDATDGHVSASARFDGGRAVVIVTQESASFTAVLNSSGEIVTQSDEFYTVLGVHDSVLLATVDRGDGLAVYNVADLSKALWEADASENGWGGTYNSGTGSWWVLIEDGFVDVKTGKAIGFGEDMAEDDPEYGYALATGSSDVVLRAEWEEGEEFDRVDPATGEEMWDDPAELDGDAWGAWVSGSTLLFEHDGGIQAFSASSGEELWSKRDEAVSQFLGSQVVTQDGSTIRLRSVKTGEEAITKHKLDDDEVIRTAGSRVLYVYDSAKSDLMGLDMKDDFSELWSVRVSRALDPEDASMGSAYLIHSDTRLFVRATASLYDEDGYSETSYDLLVELKR